MSADAWQTRACHPSTWMAHKESVLDFALAAHAQRVVDLVAVGSLAEALGVHLDIVAAIGSYASAADLLTELKEELIFRNTAGASVER